MVHRWRCGPKMQLLPHQVIFSADQKDCSSKIFKDMVHFNVCQIVYFAWNLQKRLLSILDLYIQSPSRFDACSLLFPATEDIEIIYERTQNCNFTSNIYLTQQPNAGSSWSYTGGSTNKSIFDYIALSLKAGAWYRTQAVDCFETSKSEVSGKLIKDGFT